MSNFDYPRPQKGEHWTHESGGYTVRVMSDPIEGYVLARRKGCMPFITHVNAWPSMFVKHLPTAQPTKE